MLRCFAVTVCTGVLFAFTWLNNGCLFWPPTILGGEPGVIDLNNWALLLPCLFSSYLSTAAKNSSTVID
jgi:hypothetical protein